MSAELHIALADSQFSDFVVESVGEEDGYHVIKFVDGWSIYTKNELGFSTIPYPGVSLRLWGQGAGFDVRGIGLVVDGQLLGLYRYETEVEREDRRKREIAKSKRNKEKEWADKATETTERVKRLPEAFRQRFEYFMSQPGWGPEFGPYELFVCEEAAKLLEHCKTSVEVQRIYESRDEQKRIGISDEHSGNTFGAACRLAIVFLDDPTNVPKMHGALCPLVGCEAYGCFAARAEKEEA